MSAGLPRDASTPSRSLPLRMLIASSWLVAGAAFSAALAAAQAPALPATAPTASVSQLPSANPPVQRSPSHLDVTWNGVSLRIEASNVSLNNVLHEVGRKTGMKVTGSAPEERVFGTYGPGPLNLVVPALLDGVAVNSLLTERQGGAADELALTGRNGQVTPAYIPTQQDAEAAAPATPPAGGVQPGFARGNRPGQRPGPRSAGGLPPNGNDPVVPDNGINGRDNGQNGTDNGQNGADNGVNGRDNGQNGTDNGVNNTAGTSGTQTGTGTTDGSTTASPNGVRTPQEIFQQLQRLRQQQTPQ